MALPKSFIPDVESSQLPVSFEPDEPISASSELDQLLTPQKGIFGLPQSGGETAGERLGIAGQAIADIGVGALKGVGSSAFQAVRGLSMIAGVDLQKPEILRAHNTFQKLGFGAEQFAEYFTPGLALKGAKAAVNSAKILNKLSPAISGSIKVLTNSGLEGLGLGFIKLLQSEGDVEEAKKMAILGTALSVPFEALGALTGKTAEALKASAEKQFGQALAPTKERTKELTGKAVPELLKRRIWFATRRGAETAADEGIDLAGKALERGYATLPPETKIVISPLLKKADDLIDSFKVALEKPKVIEETGEVVTHIIPDAAKSKVEALFNLKEEILDIASGTSKISIGSIRRFRQILDVGLKQAGKGFGFTGKEKAALLADKTFANGIREEIAKQQPSIAKLNAEFNLWSNLKEIVGETTRRVRGQQEFMRHITDVAAGVAGATQGVKQMILWPTMAHILHTIIKSPAWRTFSAVQKMRLSDWIVKGDLSAMIQLAEGIGGANIAR